MSEVTKYHITAVEAANLLQVLEKIEAARKRSAVMFAILDIDQHDLKICEAVLKRLEK